MQSCTSCARNLPAQLDFSVKERVLMIYESLSEKDTFKIGYDMAQEVSSGTVICLNGDLGCGKTVFAAGFAKGLGIETAICSPTFTILQVYEEGRLPLYHFDVYRNNIPTKMTFVKAD